LITRYGFIPIPYLLDDTTQDTRTIHSDFEGCADILTCDGTPQKVTIEPTMPYTNVDIFREKRVQSFSKKVWKPLDFTENWVKNKS
jgi:hypothetical protein